MDVTLLDISLPGKNRTGVELIDAIRRLGPGNRVLSTRTAKGHWQALAAQPHEEHNPLSQRERDVVRLAARGLTMPRMGEELAISARTVAFHKYRAMEAPGAARSAELVAHGRFQVRTTPGWSQATGGARSYKKNSRMTDGYALGAWPAKFGDTGVMTFIVNQDGIVQDKSRGPNTAAIPGAMKTHDPNSSWQKTHALK